MPGIATPLGEDIGGFVGVANLYRLDPPMNGESHVVVWVQPGLSASIPEPNAGGAVQVNLSPPEAVIVAAHMEGAAKVMNRLPGSYVAAEVSHAGALFLAGYEVGPPDPPEPEPPVDPPVDPPTDPEPDPPVDPEPEVP